VAETQACIEHQADWSRFKNSSGQQKLSGFRRLLRRPGENLPWQPTPVSNPQPHDENTPETVQKNISLLADSIVLRLFVLHVEL
jgi:hypothetical protein